jgi:hypothetical protein
MNTWVRKSFKVGVLSAGVLLFAGNAANADFTSIGNAGVGSGNQVNTTVQAPVDLCGNAIGAGGNASAGCVGGSWATLTGDPGNFTSIGNAGVGSGNQVNTTTQTPIDVCGNAIAGLGNAQAACVGGSWATIGGDDDMMSAYMHTTHIQSHHAKAHKAKANKAKAHHFVAGTESSHVLESTNLTSVGNAGVGSGNQANTTLQLPIDVCGNAIGVVGNAQASCAGGATATNGGGGSTTMFSGFNAGIGSGNQVNSLIQAPIDVCGNAIGLFGNAQASCDGGSTATTGGTTAGNGDDGGYQSEAAKALGIKKALGTAKAYGYGGGDDAPASCSSNFTSIGNAGVGSGNQLNTTVQTPVEISGNAIAGLGNAQAASVGGAWALGC